MYGTKFWWGKLKELNVTKKCTTYTHMHIAHIVCVSLQNAYAGTDPEISPGDGWLKFFIIISMSAEFKVGGGVDRVLGSVLVCSL